MSLPDVLAAATNASSFASFAEPKVRVGDTILPPYADAAEAHLAQWVWDRMLQEPTIAANDWLLRAMTLANEPRITGKLSRPKRSAPASETARFQESERVADWIRDQMENLQPGLRQTLWSALDLYPKGSILFEKLFETDGREVRLSGLHPLSRGSYRLEIDRFQRVVAIVPSVRRDGTVDGVERLDPAGFALFAHGGRDGDPRGAAVLRSCYEPWYRKLQTKPEHLKFLVQWGGGRMSATVPAPIAGQPVSQMVTVKRADGTLDQIPIQDYTAATMGVFAGGTAATFLNGVKPDLHPPSGDGAAFELAFDRFDREMTLAYLKQTRATTEAQNGSKADSETAAGLLDFVVAYLRSVLETIFREQVIRPLVVMRFGETVARTLCPELALAAPKTEDLGETATAVRTLKDGGFLRTQEQLNWAEEKVGMPESDGEEPIDGPDDDAAKPGQTEEAAT